MAIERNAAAEAAAGAAGNTVGTPGLMGMSTGDTEATQVRVITLNHGEHEDSTLYRMEKGFRLQFCPGPSLLGRKVFLYTNYVMTDNDEEKGEQAEFIRNQYYGLEWYRSDPEGAAGAAADGAAEGVGVGDGAGEGGGGGGGGGLGLGTGAVLTDTDVYCEIQLRRAGAYHYYFVYENAESPVGPVGSGWFHVAPTLRVGPGGRHWLPLDGLLSHTVLAKCLGPLPRWENTLRVSKETGYNMIHFTPIQELGGSGSSYSIANQLRLDPRYGAGGRETTFADVENIVTKIRTEWKMACISDVVLNHTANETAWLGEHPDATYNCANCPHLRPAAVLDAILARLTEDVARGEYAHRGVPPTVTQHQHLEAIKQLLLTQLLPEARLHEMFMCNVHDIVQEFYFTAKNKVPPVKPVAERDREELKLVPDPQHRRLAATVDMDLVLQLYNVYRSDCYDEEARLKKCSEELKRKLEQLNEAAAEQLREHLRAAVDNCIAGMSYFRLQSDGPKIEEVSAKNPLVPRYFTWGPSSGGGGGALTASEAERLVMGAGGALVMAHNGWVMNADPLQDFAARPADGRVYLRRELIAWGDSVKLRYGDRPEDSPFLWAHMREYVELTAEVFDGLRLDNCHSTPLHVAEYLLDCARNVKPDLYVVAELFTNSDSVDNIFVNRLGITSLIREALSAWDCHEQGRLVHRFAGRAVGSLARPARRPAPRSVAHALLLDLTHDNPSPHDKRCVYDTVPSAGIVAMACCATGSTRGYDELVPHHIHVVDESRLYPEWSDADVCEEGKVGRNSGIIAIKKALNKLHYDLAVNGYSEVYVDQMDADVVAITRHDPRTRQSVILVAYSAFSCPEPGGGGRGGRGGCGGQGVRPLQFEGQLEEVVLEATIVHQDQRHGQPYRKPSSFNKHEQYINGVTECEVSVRQNIPLEQSAVVGEARAGADGRTELELRALAPGGVVALRVAPPAAAAAALRRLRPLLAAPPHQDPLQLAGALRDLQLPEFAALLYRCEAEERDATGGAGGVYDVPGHGPLVYAGLQGAASLLAEVRAADDLGHPLCANLRAGDWLMEYAWRRLEGAPRLAAVAARYREAYGPLSALPRYLVPTYYDAVTGALHAAVTRAALARLAPWVRTTTFARALALTSVQLTAALPSAPLPPLSPALPPPRPVAAASLSAGLPHFAVGYMRCWGRDTFIALRGIFLLTGRYQDARYHILGFAACLRHGLIPNLLDGGRNPRYNCRDAVWWWLQSIKQYCTEAPAGWSLLAEPVSRLFPADDAEPAPPATDQPLHDVMQEALDVHFQGLVFRERNAGRAIDAHMSDKGFTVQLGVDPDTGFPFGGNDANCGTWMDKMGSSDVAGNRGKPATPRDGSAVELVGLAYSVVRWLGEQHRAGRYPYGGVARRHRDGTATTWQFAHWADRIRRSFERHFWVPPAPAAQDARPDLVHRRAIYKDSHGASQPWADYQLRCNFPIAMVVAPDLFDARHAWLALDQLERLLLGPLGVKTLDPADWAYRGDYDNSNGGDDPSVAHGFNYHQGPEWVWPIGFYLRARLLFAHENDRHARTVAAVCAALGPHLAELQASPWRGLPELTNAGGAYCGDSCRSQAWSSAAVLEVLHALREERRARPLPAD